MRVLIPVFDTKKELFSYLKENKKELISSKKSTPIFGDHVFSDVIDSKSIYGSKAQGFKTEGEDQDLNEGVIRVKTVANTANWIDSHSDMLLSDSAKKSIKDRKGMIPHLHDHIHKTTAKIGEVVDISLEELTFKQLGIKGSGTAQSVVFTTDVMKSYNDQIFQQYKSGNVKQHSIGLQYVKLTLAINDKDDKEEFAEWETYYPLVINKEKADKQGYFWVVKEYKLIENSAVLFASNELTPTLEIEKNNEPSKDTHNEPSKDIRKTLRKFI